MLRKIVVVLVMVCIWSVASYVGNDNMIIEEIKNK